MPRTARQKSSTGVYHVMMRGINHENIFDCQEDFLFFLKIVCNLKKRHQEGNSDEDWMILAYVLMNNHIHLLIKEGRKPVGDVVKKIAGAYVLYYNNKNRRDGHLFKERFKSEVCEDSDYFLTLMRYIHQNPVKAHMVNQVEEYEFSSWHEYAQTGKCQYNICNVDYVLRHFDADFLRESILSPLSDEVKCMEFEERRKLRISDEMTLQLFKEETGKDHPVYLLNMPSSERIAVIQKLKQAGCGARQLQRLSV